MTIHIPSSKKPVFEFSNQGSISSRPAPPATFSSATLHDERPSSAPASPWLRYLASSEPLPRAPRVLRRMYCIVCELQTTAISLLTVDQDRPLLNSRTTATCLMLPTDHFLTGSADSSTSHRLSSAATDNLVRVLLPLEPSSACSFLIRNRAERLCSQGLSRSVDLAQLSSAVTSHLARDLPAKPCCRTKPSSPGTTGIYLMSSISSNVVAETGNAVCLGALRALVNTVDSEGQQYCSGGESFNSTLS